MRRFFVSAAAAALAVQPGALAQASDAAAESAPAQQRALAAQLAKLQRSYDKNLKRCSHGDRAACNRSRETYAQIQQILPLIAGAGPERAEATPPPGAGGH